MTKEELFIQQIRLEEKSISLTKSRYINSIDNLKTKGSYSTSQPAQTFIKKLHQDVSTTLESMLTLMPDSSKVKLLLLSLGITPDELTYMTLRTVINCLANPREGTNKQHYICRELARLVLQNHEYTKFKLKEPWYLKHLEKCLTDKGENTAQRRWSILHKIKVSYQDIPDTIVSSEDRLKMGMYLLHGLCKATSHFFKHTYAVRKNNRVNHITIIQLSEEAKSFLEKSGEVLSFISPVNPIMVSEPKKWVSQTEGGYYLNLPYMKREFIGDRRGTSKDFVTDEKLQTAFDAVNKIQAVPWRINTTILEVIHELWSSSSGGIAGLPNKNDTSVPPKPWDDSKITNKEQWYAFKKANKKLVKDWSNLATATYKDSIASSSKRLTFQRQLLIAEKYNNYDNIYFPHYVDFRGRVYPLPSGGISPQGDDVSKALIQYSNGVELNERGAYWLAVHGANCFGIDKVSFDDRVTWVKEYAHNIKMTVRYPVSSAWWMEADKPFQFLAFCFEWAKYLNTKRLITHLPVALDGSCNGLQHLSALLLDKTGGASVNLIPSDTPSDVYAEVLETSKEILHEDINNLTLARREATTSIDIDSNTEAREVARVGLDIINRKVVKRPTMTTPYGVSRIGMSAQIKDEIKYLGKDYPIDTISMYLSGTIRDAIATKIKASQIVAEWLKEVCKAIVGGGNFMSWTVPITGFPVFQSYDNACSKHVLIGVLGEKITMRHYQSTNKPGARKHSMGVIPNYIHSMDASALMHTVLKTHAGGVTDFSFIHDSYATHANNIDVLNSALREAFVELYSQDNLRGLYDELTSRYPDIELPFPPERGALDVTQVLNSLYFFG